MHGRRGSGRAMQSLQFTHLDVKEPPVNVMDCQLAAHTLQSSQINVMALGGLNL